MEKSSHNQNHAYMQNRYMILDIAESRRAGKVVWWGRSLRDPATSDIAEAGRYPRDYFRRPSGEFVAVPEDIAVMLVGQPFSVTREPEEAKSEFQV